MIFRILIITLTFFIFSPSLFPAWFVESDFQFRVHFPRAWKKKVLRKEEALKIELNHVDSSKILAKVFVKGESDLDREIEDKLDRLNNKVKDLHVLLEKPYRKKKKKFSNMIIMILEYSKDDEEYIELTLFARFEDFYYAISGITPKTNFVSYKHIFYSTIKSLRLSSEKDEGRNDSFRYLNKNKMDMDKANAILADPQYLGKLIIYNHKYNPGNETIGKESDLQLNTVQGIKPAAIPIVLKPLPALKMVSSNSAKGSLQEEFDLSDSKYFGGN